MKAIEKLLTLILLFYINAMTAQNTSQYIYVNHVSSISTVSNSETVLPNNYNYSSSTKIKSGLSIGYKFVLKKDLFDVAVGLESSVLRYGVNNNLRITPLSLGGDQSKELNFPTINTDLYYLSLPISLRFKFKEESKLGFIIGSSIDYLVYKSEKYKTGTVTIDSTSIAGTVYILNNGESETDTDKSGYNTFNITAHLGIDYEINQMHRLNLSLHRKLLDIYDDYFTKYADFDYNAKLNLAMYSVRIGLEYKL